MKVISSSNIPLVELDDFLELDDTKKKKKKKKYNKKNKQNKKYKKKKGKKKSSNKSNKKKIKKTDNGRIYTYKGHCNRNILKGITDNFNIDLKSKVKVHINDDTINKAIDTGLSIVKCFLNRGKPST